MSKTVFSVFLFFLLNNALGQAIPDYYSHFYFLPTSPAAYQEGLVGSVNPANLLFLGKSETRFIWSTEGVKNQSIRDWGLFTGIKGLGFSAFRQQYFTDRITDYRLSTAVGAGRLAVGLAYNWAGGDDEKAGRERYFTIGSIYRPNRFLSIGLIGDFSFRSRKSQEIAEFAFRPLGTPTIALFADAAVTDRQKLSKAMWSAGAVVRVIPGLSLSGRWLNSKHFTVGVSLDFGRSGISSQARFADNNGPDSFVNTIRLGSRRESVFNTLFEKRIRYLPVNLKGRIDHQNYILFDESTHRLLDLLTTIRAASDDPRIGTIALNLSGLRVLPEHAWEVRQELQKARSAGVQIVVFADRLGMTGYHLASVADRLFLDPQGFIMLPGYRLGRTYFKGALEKLGLGFDEWRFFKYKSAFESYSRESMSEPDREQNQDYVDDWYETVREQVCQSRSFTRIQFDSLIDEDVFFTPEQAVSKGLVDSLGRWSELDELLKSDKGKSMRPLPAADLLRNSLVERRWGPKPLIAVVYGLGVCDVETGIRGRWLEKVFLRLSRESRIKAVVFRVDSPGGDGLASDLVASALKKCSEKKPVIISQGQVAGSGGYWLSMYGDTIVAGPNTITGSIGIIGGWVYDRGLSQKLGMNADVVKRGSHADMDFGVRLPLLGLSVPSRNLTEEERKVIEKWFTISYEDFVAKVAEGRGLSIEKTKEIAQGHFYSGIDGKANGLVDEIGGLMTALAFAVDRAGIKSDSDFEIVEIPKHKGLFGISLPFLPVQQKTPKDPVLEYLQRLCAEPTRPLYMMLPGTFPTLED